MKTIGIFYGSTYGMTQKAAEKIKDAFGQTKVNLYDLKNASIKDIEKYTNLIFGTSAWGIGEMQDEWEMTIDHLSEIDFSNRKVALFGLGDQLEYPESFVDGLGTMYCRLPDKSCVVGLWPSKGYDYYFSLADKDGKFVGLVLDDHNQENLTDKRISEWVKQLKKEFI
ncbi:MAG: flavodoxin [Lentimicrobiaceae bacterium]|jgi:flavodoxin I|nr:flavodoxin [Lentimicrobiaceae bacterium]MDG2081076.1 flavodoxin [Bacteroidales bacterium]|tara:strand:+ start:5767 stop:6270 length:504 start_codon:yes stop_codon:yes gene_type:complete